MVNKNCRFLSLQNVGALLLFLGGIANAETNTWVASEGSDGLASTAANWSLGRAPTAADDILFDGVSSSVDCLWDAAAVSTVASWTQRAGTNTIATVYPEQGDFTCLTIAGNLLLEGGGMTHLANTNTEQYRLHLAVGGNLSVAAGAMLDGRNKGYDFNAFPVLGTPGGHAMGIHAGGGIALGNFTYGNVKQPESLGTGTKKRSGVNVFGVSGLAGGGAIKLDVGGAVTLHGEINVNGYPYVKDIWGDQADGSAGSIWIRAAAVEGTGQLYAHGIQNTRAGERHGSGGRIAIELTSATTLGLPTANIFTEGAMSGDLVRNSGVDYHIASSTCGGGTFFLTTPTSTHGTLTVANALLLDSAFYTPSEYGTTQIPDGQTWEFDAIIFKNAGILSVPTNTTLRLPNGLASVTGNSLQGGILMAGGTLELPEGPQVIQSVWTLGSSVPFTLNRDLTVRNGGAIGNFNFYNSKVHFTKSDVTIDGDLTVEANGFINANGYGASPRLSLAVATFTPEHWCHGGQVGYYGYATNGTYGSILRPQHPGVFCQSGSAKKTGGGFMKVTVTGTLTLDGTATSMGNTENTWSYACGTGGSLDITAGELVGDGSIKADGWLASGGNFIFTQHITKALDKENCYCSPGGRISVRLTNPGAEISEAWRDRITAFGASHAPRPEYQERFSSAGTIYLQQGDEAEGCGTILIHDPNNGISTNAFTQIPSAYGLDAPEDLSGTTLQLAENARVAVGAESLTVAHVRIDDTSSFLELGGRTLYTKSLRLCGTRVPTGTYAAADALLEGLIHDSTTEQTGRVVVMGESKTTLLIIQ